MGKLPGGGLSWQSACSQDREPSLNYFLLTGASSGFLGWGWELLLGTQLKGF